MRVILCGATPEDADTIAEIWHGAWRDGHVGHGFYERNGWRDVLGFDYAAEIRGGTLPVPCRRYEKRILAAAPASPGPSGG